MGSSLRCLALSLLVCLFTFSSVNKLHAQHDRLGAAFWKNVDPHTAVITKLFINDLDHEITAYETCRGGDVSWGAKTLKRKGRVYVATYNQDFANYELNVRMLSENRLHVLAKMKYRDSDEWDVWEYSFYRSYEMGSSGGISNK